ncbi:hypothetical protein OEA41_002300 [Lepraria neglecta]|uniref:Cytochrome P450 alkane hydroxylase n=1 Tax=Lepraria neglecta TaxID=209136 RepID=A0AAD9ZBC5_9LECA|nr:hypothetical protein OEA41_002300 [Lepraria neglecta]
MLDLLLAYPHLFLYSLILIPLLYLALTITLKNQSIRRLGTYAPTVRGYLPFGIDIFIRSLRGSRTDTDYEFWDWLFNHSSNAHSKTIETTLARQRFLFTADPENIKAILATQFADYGKGEPFHEDWKHFLGDSIFTTDGEMWHQSRQLLRPQFVKTRVSDLEIFETHVQRLMHLIPGEGWEVDISALFYRFTLDSATDYLLGKSVDSLDNPNAEFVKAFAEVQRGQNEVSRSGPFHKLLPKGRFFAGLNVINSFVEPFIDQALRLNLADLKEKTNQSFLHALAATGTRDRKVIRDQVVAVLLAGRDTTASSLSFTFLELSKNPAIVKKLRREILERVGPTERPTYDDLKNMPYLQHVMNETLRLYPSVPFNVRMSLHDTTLPTGGGPDGTQPIGVLKDTPIAYSALYMQRREDLFPPASDGFPHVLTYCPERWDKWTPKSWTYIPFNGGPRICIGQQFALTEMSYTIVRILQRFERIDKYWDERKQKLKAEIVISPATGVQVGFWEAKSG